VTLTPRFDEALAFASDLHRTQKRKTSGAPYISHLLGVCSLVLEDGGSEDQAIAALLHDSVEDQGTSFDGGAKALLDVISSKFGPEVVRLVDALTEIPTTETRAIANRRDRFRAHKQLYIDQIVTYDLAVRRISCADSLYNVRSLITGYREHGDKLWKRFMTRDPADQLWAYQSIARAFLETGGTLLAAELQSAVAQLEQLVASGRHDVPV